MSTEQRELAGLSNADARTVLSNRDLDNPNEVNDGVKVSPDILDYTKIRDVEYFIEFTSFEYSRGISGGDTGRGKVMVVRLPLLSSVRMSYSMNYTSSKMELFYDAAIKAVQAGKSGITGDFNDAVGKAVEGISQATGAVSQTARNALSMGGEYREQLNNQLGSAKNPRMEASFVGIGMRSHAFGFVLVPRNAEENALINSIIKALKLRMHPEIADGLTTPSESFLKYPDEFVISFRSARDGSLLNIPTIPDCFLASFDAEYNPNGTARFFDDNSAVSYRIELGFIEGNQLTRRDIENGGY